jgi:N-acetylneuraminate lyase
VLLSIAARETMAEAAIRTVNGRVPVMIHVGAINTGDAVTLARHAEAAGADAVSAVPPFYYSYSFEAIRDHYAAIAEATELPLYLYFIPGATGTAISPEQLLEICAIDGVAGFKYTSQDLYYLSRVMSLRDPARTNILSGPDELFMLCLALGAEGAIGTTYNFMPRLYVDIMESYTRGEVTVARELQRAATDVIAVLIRHGVLPSTKALLAMLGFPVGHGVPPMPALIGSATEALRQDLETCGFFELVARASLYGPKDDPMRGRLA